MCIIKTVINIIYKIDDSFYIELNFMNVHMLN